MENYDPNRWAQTHTQPQSHQFPQTVQRQNWSNGNWSIGRFESGEYHDSFQNRTQTYFGDGRQNVPLQDCRQYDCTQTQNYQYCSNQFSHSAGWHNLSEASRY